MIGETMVCPKCRCIANHDSYFSAMVCRQCGWMRYDKPTPADQIRRMNDQELAEFIDNIQNDAIDSEGCIYGLHFPDDKETPWIDWLRQPVEE